MKNDIGQRNAFGDLTVCMMFLSSIFSISVISSTCQGRQTATLKEPRPASVPTAFQDELTQTLAGYSNLQIRPEDYLHQAVRGIEDSEQLRRLIVQLGSESYQQRRVAEATLFSLPVLPEEYKTSGTANNDMEIRFRLNSIFRNRKTRKTFLLKKALDDIANSKLNSCLEDCFLLWENTQNGSLKSQAYQTIFELVSPSNEAQLMKKIASEKPATRNLAANLLVAINADHLPEKLQGLLVDSSEANRLSVAILLLEKNHRPAIKTLISLIGSPDRSIAFRAEAVLNAATGVTFGRLAGPQSQQTKDVLKMWNEWSTAQIDTVQLRLPLKETMQLTNRLNGNTLIAINQSTVIEFDANRNEMVRLDIPGVLGAEKTDDGNYLCFSFSRQWIRKITPEGKVLWELKGEKYNNAMPLGPETILVTIGPRSLTREINSSTGKTVWEYKSPWWANDAFRLENGNTLIGGKGGIVEVSPEKKVIWEYKNNEGATLVVAKPTNHGTILAGWTNGLAREIDRAGKATWEYRTNKLLSDVFRDNNGHTLFAEDLEIFEIDQDKKIIWRTPKRSKTASVRR
ncbi:MAG: hypothetical protein P8M80_01990 [Pirellulaceae bacterium]|nr:hypothetical protein [Pirellulaceae bacterium]